MHTITVSPNYMVALGLAPAVMQSITASQVLALKSTGRVVVGYPRKGVICVDGFKYFKACEKALAAVKAN